MIAGRGVVIVRGASVRGAGLPDGPVVLRARLVRGCVPRGPCTGAADSLAASARGGGGGGARPLEAGAVSDAADAAIGGLATWDVDVPVAAPPPGAPIAICIRVCAPHAIYAHPNAAAGVGARGGLLLCVEVAAGCGAGGAAAAFPAEAGDTPRFAAVAWSVAPGEGRAWSRTLSLWPFRCAAALGHGGATDGLILLIA